MRVRWYWLRFAKGFRVTFHLASDHAVTWTQVHGVQIGGWFLGVVRSATDQPSDESIDYSDIPALSAEQIASMKRVTDD